MSRETRVAVNCHRVNTSTSWDKMTKARVPLFCLRSVKLRWNSFWSLGMFKAAHASLISLQSSFTFSWCLTSFKPSAHFESYMTSWMPVWTSGLISRMWFFVSKDWCRGAGGCDNARLWFFLVCCTSSDQDATLAACPKKFQPFVRWHVNPGCGLPHINCFQWGKSILNGFPACQASLWLFTWSLWTKCEVLSRSSTWWHMAVSPLDLKRPIPCEVFEIMVQPMSVQPSHVNSMSTGHFDFGSKLFLEFQVLRRHVA